ncbi:MAG: Gfo/Idh/MocA family oxidoreductase [Actinomycetia bacterium]|nr:Gfo/Idh/MocA family oxidoreductase [Actinomycetes bacterium]
MTDNTMVNWGFIGAGGLATGTTAKSLHNSKNGKLYAAAARDENRARNLSPEVAYDSYEKLIQDPNVDAVYISLNNDAHLPWILKSLDAGKHVLCEKPMVMNAGDTVTAYAHAQEKGLLLVEAVWSLWHPRSQRVKELVAGGAIGSPTNYLGTFTFDEVTQGNYRLDPAMGGGALYDVGIYPLHGLVALLAEETEYRVTQASEEKHSERVDLTTKAQFSFEGTNAKGTGAIIASFAMHPSQRFVLKGSEGEISLPGDQAFTSHNQASELTITSNGVTTTESFAAVDPYQLMFENVSDATRGNGGWLPSPWQSIQVAKIVDQVFTLVQQPA